MIKNFIYDVGLHTGEDTAFYLAKGFKVLAFEANPILVASAEKRFAAEIAEGRLQIISGAICDSTANYISFYKKEGNSELGTIESDWVKKNEIYSGSVEEIKVPVVRMKDILAKFGVPYYMKIDVEGVDRICVNSLRYFEEKPEYLSLELERSSFDDARLDLNLLVELGYSSFALVNQQSIPGTYLDNDQREGSVISWRFPRSCSGAFGQDIKGNWIKAPVALKKIKQLFLAYRIFGDSSFLKNLKVGRYNIGSESINLFQKILKRPVPGWHDLHAKISKNGDARD